MWTISMRKRIAAGILALVAAAVAAVSYGAQVTPVPLISFVSPVSATAGGADFTLTVSGADFVASSVVNWNGSALSTTFVNADELTATVPAAQIASGGTGQVTVQTLGCSGTCTLVSNVVYVPVGAATSGINVATLSSTVGAQPFQLSEGDFNGDGKLDLAVANLGADTVSILLGNGDGTFQAQTTISTLSEPFGIAVGDLNGDGVEDLVIGNDTSGLNVAIGNGDGTFTVITLATGSCAVKPALADMNRDGKLDIVVANECGNGIVVYLGNGNGTFQAATTILGSLASYAAVVADLNGDGNLDIVAASQGTNMLDVYTGTGTGAFSAVTHYTAVSTPWALAAADFDGDGKIDVVVGSHGSSGFVFLKGNGDASFAAPVSITNSGSNQDLATGDLNTDGKLDLVSLSGAGVVEVRFANGDGTFQAPQTIGNGNGGYGLTLGNFATAGGLNVAATGSSANVHLYLQTVLLSPASENFGAVGIGSSAQQVFTVTNATSNTVNVAGISFTGANTGDFSQNNTCSSPLAPAATCAITVTFAPSATGARSGSLSIADDAPGSPQTAALTGSGMAAPVVSLSTASVNFGNQNVGVQSGAMSVMVTNTGNAPLTGLTPSFVGANNSDFAQVNNCPNSLAATAGCAINVRFTPGALGASSATMQIADNAGNSPQLVALSGTGILTATQLLFSTAPPVSIVAGSSIGVISVGVYTMQSTLVTNSNASIQVTISGPNGFSNSLTQGVTSGIATFDFSSVHLNTGGQYTVAATSGGLVSASANTAVTPQVSSKHMNIVGFPAHTFSMVPHNFAVLITDAFGNTVTTYSGTVTLSSSDFEAVITPTMYTFTGADLGTHTFSGTLVTLGAQSISVTDGTLPATADTTVNARPQFVVNTAADDAGSSACDGNGICTLRSAIAQANTQGAGDISVDTSQFQGSAPFTLTLAGGALDLSSFINIAGPGAANLIISANQLSSVFTVEPGAIATISGVTATDGNSAGNGGGIENAGMLALTNVAVRNSSAAASGGGIYSTGTLTVNASTISGNSATLNGGGLANGGTMTVYDSTVSGNTASGNGGGISNSGALTAPQSTLAGNSAVDGAAIENQVTGTLLLVQSTLSGNTATAGGGTTISNANAANNAVAISDSIVAGNISPGGDCPDCGPQSPFNVHDISAATLQLGALADNGGATKTMAPLAGSPAIGAGSVALAQNPGVPQSLANDQRGEGFVRVVNGSVDLGAVQANAGPASTLAIDVAGTATAGEASSVTVNVLTQSGNPAATYTGTVHFDTDDDQAILPGDYTFVAGDGGSHVFSVTLKTSGYQYVTVTDTVNNSLTASQAISTSPAAAAEVADTAGSGQSAAVSTTFAAAMQVKVTDAFGNGVPSVSVLFTAPSNGASGTFAGGGASATAQTGGTGLATAPAFTANAKTGEYSVTAEAPSLDAATFTLTNLAAATYTVRANPDSLTIAQGQSGNTVLTFTPAGGFAETVQLSCGGLPANANCVFVPATAVMTGNNAVVTVTLTVNTTGTNGVMAIFAPPSGPRETRSRDAGQLTGLLGALLAAMILGLGATRRNRRRWPLAFAAMVLVAASGVGMAGCSGHTTATATPSPLATVPGTYPVNVTASVGNSGSQTALVTITIVKE